MDFPRHPAHRLGDLPSGLPFRPYPGHQEEAEKRLRIVDEIELPLHGRLLPWHRSLRAPPGSGNVAFSWRIPAPTRAGRAPSFPSQGTQRAPGTDRDECLAEEPRPVARPQEALQQGEALWELPEDLHDGRAPTPVARCGADRPRPLAKVADAP